MNSAAIIVIIVVTASKSDPLRGVDYYLRWETGNRSSDHSLDCRERGLKLDIRLFRNKCGQLRTPKYGSTKSGSGTIEIGI